MDLSCAGSPGFGKTLDRIPYRLAQGKMPRDELFRSSGLPEKPKRHGVETVAETRADLAVVEYHSRLKAVPRGFPEPAQSLEVLLCHRTRCFYFHAGNGRSSSRPAASTPSSAHASPVSPMWSFGVFTRRLRRLLCHGGTLSSRKTVSSNLI